MSPDSTDPEDLLPRMSLAEHLDELRARVIRSALALFAAMTLAFVFWHPIWDFVRHPYDEATALLGLPDAQLMAVDPGEGFLGVLKVCFLAGLVAASPVVIWQLWGFVSAGLYPHERRVVRIFFPVSLGLFAIGMVLAYVVLIPFGFRWLIGWDIGMQVRSEFRIDTYISTCLMMVFGMALVFELPLLMLFLEAVGIVTRETFRKHWRIAVVVAFVIGMILTDPSPVTQVMMAMPLVGLYFLGIWGGRYVGEGRVPFRWYHAWPLVLGALLIALLLVFSSDLNAWSARVFGLNPTSAPTAPTAPTGP